MQVVELSLAARFAPDKYQKVNLFESSRMFCDIYCLEPGQEQAPHSHDENDKIYYVVEGSASVTVGDETRSLTPGHAVLCPPGEDHGVRNDTDDRLVVLVFMAPHPHPPAG